MTAGLWTSAVDGLRAVLSVAWPVVALILLAVVAGRIYRGLEKS